MNTFGTIAGYYVDANNVYHGFVRDQRGRFITSFDAPGAGAGSFQGTLAVGIDERGVIAGSYIDANNVNHGFVRDADGTVATFDPPGAAPACLRRRFIAISPPREPRIPPRLRNASSIKSSD